MLFHVFRLTGCGGVGAGSIGDAGSTSHYMVGTPENGLKGIKFVTKSLKNPRRPT